MRISAVAVAWVVTAALATTAAEKEVTLPRGTSIELRMVTPFDSDRVEKGKLVQAAALRSLYVDGRLVIPKDSVVMGQVRHVRGTRDKARSGAIAVRFGTVEFPGEAFAIDGVANEWAASGEGAPISVRRGTVVAMRLNKPLILRARRGEPEAGDRRILVSPDSVRRAQSALATRGLYTGEPSGALDDPTRRALAAYQIQQGQPATGDLDEVTAAALAAR